MSESTSSNENPRTLTGAAVEQKSIDSLNTNLAHTSGDASQIDSDTAAQMLKE